MNLQPGQFLSATQDSGNYNLNGASLNTLSENDNGIFIPSNINFGVGTDEPSSIFHISTNSNTKMTIQDESSTANIGN